MFRILTDNIANIIISLMLISFVYFIIKKMITDSKAGKGCIGCDCKSCAKGCKGVEYVTCEDKGEEDARIRRELS